MRLIAFTVAVVSSLALVSCSSIPRKSKANVPNNPTEAQKTMPPGPQEDQPSDSKGFKVPNLFNFGKIGKGKNAITIEPLDGFNKKAPCPETNIVYDAARMVEINGPEKFENVGFTGEFYGVDTKCRYQKDNVQVALSLKMGAGRGPKASGLAKDYNYWVAVTQKDVEPISKDDFTQIVKFGENQDRKIIQTDTVTLNIPRDNINKYEILVGFQLTPQQIEFNRDGKRFKINANANNSGAK